MSPKLESCERRGSRRSSYDCHTAHDKSHGSSCTSLQNFLLSVFPSADAASYSLKTIYTPPVTTLIISRVLFGGGGKKATLTMASGCYLCLSIPLLQQFSLRDINNNNGSSLGYILKGRLVVGLPVCLSLSSR